MSQEREQITDLDLDAYVDDQLEPSRRVEVAAWLARHPEAAARVMQDFRTRDELRMALRNSGESVSPATAGLAIKLERGLRLRKAYSYFRQAAAVLFFIGAGWAANEMIGPLGVTESVASAPPPAYVEDAMRAH